MADQGTVGICTSIPAELHHAVKTLAAAQRMTLRQFLIESLRERVERGYAPAREPRGAASG